MGALRWFVVSMALAGCASAGKGNSIIGGITDAGAGDPGPRGDANDFPALDAATIDAPPEEITLTQTVSTTITRNNSFVCFDDVTNLTFQNSYYRVFALADHGITTMLHVAQVDFGIELADAGPSATQQPAQLLLGTYGTTPMDPTLDPAQIRTLTAIDIKIPDGAGTRLSVPITADVAPGTNLIVELTIPDGGAAGSVFVIGSNAQGERRPGYTSAPDCALPVPTTMQSIARQIMAGDADIIMSVTGTH
jgi:hypothetical protein